MPNLVLSDVQVVTFKNVDFNAQIVEWNDTRKPRLAFHEYLKRDGAEAEYMGRAPHSVRFNIVYIGQNWRKDLSVLQATIDEFPIGPLIHPFWGRMQAACEGIDNARVNLEDGVNTVTVPISFRESQLDSRLVASTAQGPAYRQAQVKSYCSGLSLGTTIYAIASTAITLFINTALAYANAALATTVSTTTSTGSADPTLQQQLASVVSTGKSARDAVRADPAASGGDAATYSTIQQIELVMDACAQLDESLKRVKPVLQPYVVPATTNLMTIAQKFYGKDAASRLAEIQANNIGKVLNPAVVPAGTNLLMAPPTVQVLT